MTSPSASRTASPDGLDDGTVALRDHITLLTGYPFKSEFYTEQPDGVRLVRGDNVVQGQLRWDNVKRWPLNRIDEAKGYELREGDVVLAMDRPWIEAGLKYARIGSDDVPSLLVQRVSCLRAKDGLDQGYLFYLIGSHRFTDHVLSIQTGTAVPHISGPQILQFRYRPLPIDSQRAIAAVLGSLDDKIEQNRRTARALERLARAIFRAWFVDFEPVKAKAAGAASFPSMPQAIFDALPATFTDCDLGPVPEGWEIVPFSRECKMVSGGTPKRSEPDYWGGDVPWYSVKDAPSDGCVWIDTTEEAITQQGLENSAAMLVPKGCTIISARGTVGKLALTRRPMTFNQSCYGLLPTDDASCFYLYFLTQHAVNELQQRTHGSVFDTITRATFDMTYVVAAPSRFRCAFNDAVDPLLESILACTRESGKLTALRDYLLPQLLNGQVPVEVGNA